MNRNTSMSIINGRVTKKVTLTYTYTVIPHREGKIEIPAIAVQADGKTYRTEPQVILVTSAASAGAREKRK